MHTTSPDDSGALTTRAESAAEPTAVGPRPFSRADALAAGISPKVLRGSRFRRLFRGIYIGSETKVTADVRAAAALLLHVSDAYASHLTAARVYGLPVPESAEEHVSVFEEKDRRPRPGLRSHLSPPNVRVSKVRGIRVSEATDTFIALATIVSLVDLVVVGDSMVRLGLTTPEQLVEAADGSQDRRAVLARRAAGLVREGVDSPMETRLRMLIVLAGLPEPVVNHIVRDRGGEWRLRFDLSYPWLRLLVEYDGRQHADDTAQWLRDIERREQLDRAGWRLIIVTSAGIYTEPARTLARILEALRQRGCPRLPRRLNDEWRRHFLRL